jgi:uncharacterized 2Fe-2S/4Fe-4S cluster protein (DUF4445 family)
MSTCKVKFTPSDRTIKVPKGTDILNAALACGAYINSSCGGEGVCGRCKVIVKKGDIKTEPTGRISKEERKKGYVLACRTTIHSNAEIEIPPESRLDKQQILTEEAKFDRLAGIYTKGVEVAYAKGIKEELLIHSPLATKLHLKLPSPTLQDSISDLERIYRAIRKVKEVPPMQTGLANVKKLGRLLRESNWNITVTLGRRNGTTEVVLIEPGDTSSRNYGVAIDVGTTTIVTQLVDLNTKEVLGTRASHNPQSSHGEDVITRIIYAQKGHGGLERLHHAVIDIINEHIASLVSTHNINLNDVTAVISAGNMTMTHILLRVDPTYIRKEPYVGTANFLPVIRAAEAGIRINPRGLLAALPGVATYVGGDIVAGVLASRMSEEKEITALLDIGTNGEIVLGNKEWLACCSASAGPAFEGSGVKCGVRAREGAVQEVRIDKNKGELDYSTIGNKPPVGICGSGYITLLAELFKANIIDREGKFVISKSNPRFKKSKDGMEYVIAWAKESATKNDIVITQHDISNLIRSKGAIFSALLILAKKMGISFEDIQRFYVAGGFGNYLDVESAIWCGMLPDVPSKRVKFIGNSSLAGARLSLLSYPAYMKAREIAQHMTYIDLSTDTEFMREYTAALFIPHTDMSHFPRVKI